MGLQVPARMLKGKDSEVRGTCSNFGLLRKGSYCLGLHGAQGLGLCAAVKCLTSGDVLRPVP